MTNIHGAEHILLVELKGTPKDGLKMNTISPGHFVPHENIVYQMSLMKTLCIRVCSFLSKKKHTVIQIN